MLDLTGDKSAAVAAAREAGLPTLTETEPTDDPKELAILSQDQVYPLFVKAVAGGGGRGMRFVEKPEDLEKLAAEASREAAAAFGDGRVYAERAVINPQHIEVQILAMPRATSFTSTSAIARCSAGTRRSLRLRRRSISTLTCVTRSVQMPWPLLATSGTWAQEPWNFWLMRTETTSSLR